MTKMLFKQTFVEELEAIVEKVEKKKLKKLFNELKLISNEIEDKQIDKEELLTMDGFSHIKDNGFVFRYEKFRLFLTLKSESIEFIGVITLEDLMKNYLNNNTLEKED